MQRLNVKKTGWRLAAVLLALLLGGCVRQAPPEPDVVSSLPEPVLETPVTATPAPPKDEQITLLAAGDNLIHDVIYRQAAQRATVPGSSGYDFTFAYQRVAERIAAADVAVLNQETVIAPSLPPSTYPAFNSPPELGDHMRAIGFDVFSLANNHILDQGQRGVNEAADYWHARDDVIISGLYPVGDEQAGVSTLQCGDITLAFVAFTEHTNGIVQRADRYEVIYTSEEERMQSLISYAATISDLVVVSVHWGNEGTTVVTEAQQALAQKFADWGAGVILGTHPHVLQRTELLTSVSGQQVPAIYSLGNFISAQSNGANLVSGLLELTITKPADGGRTYAGFSGFIPLVTHYEAGMSNVCIYPLEQYSQALCEQHGVRVNTPGFSMEYIQKLVQENIRLF